MEKKQDRRAISSIDAEDVSSAAQSQLRKRFDLGGDSTSTTQPNALRSSGFTRNSRREPVTSENGAQGPNERPTIPTPRPRISLGAVPRRLVDEKGMMSLPLDHRAAFLLMSIDGKTAVRSLIDVTGMQPEEVLVLIERLVELKAVALL